MISIKNKHITLLFLFQIFTLSISLAQSSFSCDYTNNKKAKLYYSEALELIKNKQKGVAPILKKVIKEDTAFAAPCLDLGKIYYSRAIKSQYDIKDQTNVSYYYSKAEKYFLRTIELCEEIDNYSALLFLGELYFTQKEYALSNYYLSQYVNKTNSKDKAKAFEYIEKYKLWKNWNDNPHDIKITPVENICTPNDEFLPYITHNGKELYYTKRYKKENPNTMFYSTVEDFFVSTSISTDSLNNWVFETGNKMKYPFNEGRNQGAISISGNSSKMLITICTPSKVNNKPFANCDLYYSEKNTDYWSPLEPIGNQINGHETWEAHPTVSKNDNILIFSSKRSDSFGGSDLYFCVKAPNGNWSKPKNIGEPINTVNDEKAPFLHYDNKTLYFSSNGHFGLGGFDIFVSHKQKDGKWSKPVNMGKPLNTVEDEIGFVVDARGTKAYFGSNHFMGKGGWDIFATDLPKKFRPQEMLIINGKIIDTKKNKLPQATLRIINAQDINDFKNIKNSDGYFSEIYEKSKTNFFIEAQAQDFTYWCKKIDVSNKNNGIFTNIEIEKIKTGCFFELSSVLFNSDSFELTHESKNALKLFTNYLENYPSLHFKITGYTDNTASSKYNYILSERRAKEVHSYLCSLGIEPNRMDFEGKGEDKPISTNLTDLGKSENRRIEIEILRY